MRGSLVLTIISLLFIGCGSKDTSEHSINSDSIAEKSKDELIVNSEDGWYDFTLKITGIEKKDEASLYHIQSTYKGHPVGFDVLIPENKDTSGFGHGLVLISTGEPSNSFLEVLFQYYTPGAPGNISFCSNDTVNYVDLTAMGKKYGADPEPGRKLKLFFETPDAEDELYHYAEVFININEEAMELEFNEKDQEYRGDLIWFLNCRK